MNQQAVSMLRDVGTDDVASVGHDVSVRAGFEGGDAIDAQAVARFQHGDADTFVGLYERHFSRIYGDLRVLLRDYHEAEDVAQQTFIKAYEALPRFELRDGTPFRCWLFRIARNEALGHLRKHGRIQVEQTEKIELRLDGPSAPPVLSWLTDREVLLFVERLPTAQRQVLAMRYGLSLTTQEVADVLGRTPVAVRKLEHRALRFLEQRLESTGSAQLAPWRAGGDAHPPAPGTRPRRTALRAGGLAARMTRAARW